MDFKCTDKNQIWWNDIIEFQPLILDLVMGSSQSTTDRCQEFRKTWRDYAINFAVNSGFNPDEVKKELMQIYGNSFFEMIETTLIEKLIKYSQTIMIDKNIFNIFKKEGHEHPLISICEENLFQSGSNEKYMFYGKEWYDGFTNNCNPHGVFLGNVITQDHKVLFMQNHPLFDKLNLSNIGLIIDLDYSVLEYYDKGYNGLPGLKFGIQSHCDNFVENEYFAELRIKTIEDYNHTIFQFNDND